MSTVSQSEGSYECTKTDYKVYVSRIPKHWTQKLMHEHFVTLKFGRVSGVELFASKRVRKDFERRGAGNICYAFKNTGKCDKGDACLFSHSTSAGGEDSDSEDGGGKNLGSGVVYFDTQEAVDNALNQNSLHVSRKIIKISPFESVDEGRDTSICYAWKNFQCTHGDTCKFLHEGPGAVQKVGTPYQGRKFQCLSFKTKGKCSKGDACKFLHEAGKVKPKRKLESTEGDSKGEIDDNDNDDGNTPIAGSTEKQRGLCRQWKKKGKCRNGDKCLFDHPTSVQSGSNALASTSTTADVNGAKRRRIDGKALVAERKNSKLYFKDD